MLKVIIEKPFIRSQEVKDYYEIGDGKNSSITQVEFELRRWFCHPWKPCSFFQVGRGGSHAWIADSEGNRMMIIEENL